MKPSAANWEVMAREGGNLHSALAGSSDIALSDCHSNAVVASPLEWGKKRLLSNDKIYNLLHGGIMTFCHYRGADQWTSSS